MIQQSLLAELGSYEVKSKFDDREYVKAMAEELLMILEAYKLKGTITDVRATDMSVMFDIVPDAGVSVKQFRSARTELELYMGAPVEIASVGGGKCTIGLAVKALKRPIVGLRSMLETKEFIENDYRIPIAAGLDVLGKPFVFDLTATPHLLVAGTTGSGKSVFLNDIIMSILMTKRPDEVQFLMIDPKRVELSCYEGIPHLMAPIVYEREESIRVLDWVEREMMARYDLFAKMKIRDIDSYNDKVGTGEKIPRVVVIVDEYMQLMMDDKEKRKLKEKTLDDYIVRLARMGRASGIHLVIATQRPSSNVITSQIKSNVPCRASFTVIDWRESKTIIDRTGAERLLGSGDMLFSTGESALPVHAQAAYITNDEIDRIISKARRLRY